MRLPNQWCLPSWQGPPASCQLVGVAAQCVQSQTVAPHPALPVVVPPVGPLAGSTAVRRALALRAPLESRPAAAVPARPVPTLRQRTSRGRTPRAAVPCAASAAATAATPEAARPPAARAAARAPAVAFSGNAATAARAAAAATAAAAVTCAVVVTVVVRTRAACGRFEQLSAQRQPVWREHRAAATATAFPADPAAAQQRQMGGSRSGIAAAPACPCTVRLRRIARRRLALPVAVAAAEAIAQLSRGQLHCAEVAAGGARVDGVAVQVGVLRVDDAQHATRVAAKRHAAVHVQIGALCVRGVNGCGVRAGLRCGRVWDGGAGCRRVACRRARTGWRPAHEGCGRVWDGGGASCRQAARRRARTGWCPVCEGCGQVWGAGRSGVWTGVGWGGLVAAEWHAAVHEQVGAPRMRGVGGCGV
eukprot:243841-Chlamydomonas_euryale.AAC.4